MAQAAAGAAAAAKPKMLIIADFDWSLVEENTDTWVIEQLGAGPIYRKLREQGGLAWTQLMDAVLTAAATELGKGPEDVAAALASVPADAGLLAWLRRAAARTDVEMCIVSDANSHYISQLLALHGLSDAFSETHTNPAAWDASTGALRVSPYDADPHGCPRCPRNLCKGRVVARLLAERKRAGAQQPQRLVYIGDGKGDFCPSSRLLAGQDGAGEAEAVVLAREEYTDGAPCALWVMLEQQRRQQEHGGEQQQGQKVQLPRRRLAAWSTPAELVSLLQEECGSS